MVALALASFLAMAQPTNNDYYQARNNQQMAELLNAVEKYHLQPGIDKMRSRSYSAAWGDFNFILNYFPNHPRALLLMGELCEKWRNPKCNVGGYFDKALQISPSNSGIHLTKGIYLQKQGKLDEAVESYRKSLEINPDFANAHYNLGLAYAEQKKFALANEHAQKAYALGIALPGLRSKLAAAGAWKEIEARPAEKEQKAPEPATAEAKPAPASGEAKTGDGGK